MYFKICPVCKKKSYSASLEKQWICPYCNADITTEKAQLVNLKN